MFEKTKLIITDDHASNKGIFVQFCNTHYFDFRLVNFLKLEWFESNIRMVLFQTLEKINSKIIFIF